MKTLPEILVDLHNKTLNTWILDGHTNNDKCTDIAQEAIAKELMEILEFDHTSDNDDELLDEVRASLTAFIGKEK